MNYDGKNLKTKSGEASLVLPLVALKTQAVLNGSKDWLNYWVVKWRILLSDPHNFQLKSPILIVLARLILQIGRISLHFFLLCSFKRRLGQIFDHYPFHIYRNCLARVWFSFRSIFPSEDILPYLEIFQVQQWESLGCYWHLVGRGQGYSCTSYNAQERSQQSIIRPPVGPWLRDLGVDTWDQIPALLCSFCLGFPSCIIWDSTSANLVG